MGAIKRNPTPFGPVSDLFDRLDDLHLAAGRPSMREIATRIGRGASVRRLSTTCSAGRGYPGGASSKLVVEDLGGNVAVFRGLWQAAGWPRRRRKTRE